MISIPFLLQKKSHIQKYNYIELFNYFWSTMAPNNSDVASNRPHHKSLHKSELHICSIPSTSFSFALFKALWQKKIKLGQYVVDHLNVWAKLGNCCPYGIMNRDFWNMIPLYFI